nr:starch synthase 1, chloroplastic/amyloplastic-like [Tanacetum cinerariifolium]
WPPRITLGRLLPHARGLGFKHRRGGFPSGAKKEWGLSPKAKVRVLHTAQLDVTILVDTIDLPIAKGCKYCNRDDASSCLVRFGVDSLLASKYRSRGIYKDARSIALIHNLSHQGVDPAATYGNLGLPYEWHGALEWVFPTWARTHALDTGQAVNILKGAIVTSDRISTVSQGYSWEITTPEGGHGMNELLTSRKIYREHDLMVADRVQDCSAKKIGLPVRPGCPLVGYQKFIKDLDKSLADELDSFDALIFRKCLIPAHSKHNNSPNSQVKKLFVVRSCQVKRIFSHLSLTFPSE